MKLDVKLKFKTDKVLNFSISKHLTKAFLVSLKFIENLLVEYIDFRIQFFQYYLFIPISKPSIVK